MFGSGLPELGILLVIGMLLFGSTKLPQLGKGLGEAISGFKNALHETAQGERKVDRVDNKSTHNKI